MIAITLVDRQIDAIRADLTRREAVDAMSAASWQKAWDRHPRLRAREKTLFMRRSLLVIERDRRAGIAARKAERAFRSEPPVACPTCGTLTYRAHAHN